MVNTKTLPHEVIAECVTEVDVVVTTKRVISKPWWLKGLNTCV